MLFLKDYSYVEEGKTKTITKNSEVAKLYFEIDDEEDEDGNCSYKEKPNVVIAVRIPDDNNNLRKVPMVINDLREYLGYQGLF